MRLLCNPRVLVYCLLINLASLLLGSDGLHGPPYAHGQQASGAPLYGFTAFPYDYTAEAIERTNSIIVANSTLYALHFDKCVPWKEALSDAPFPGWMQRDWRDIKRRIPDTHVVYVAVTPSATDRQSLAPACGDSEGEEESIPRSWRRADASFDHPEVIKAYLNYVKRVVEFFHPRYIVIGIEISDLSLRNPAKWPRFETLFVKVHDTLKVKYPNLQIGAEFILQSLMHPRVAKQVKPVVEKSDYLGLSFYPYGSDFGVKFGAPPLPSGVDQWRKPLNWVRQYTDKPIAICETGYTTQDARLPQYDLHLRGDLETQRAYLHDLVKISKRDNYVFVVWFLAIDYDKLYAKMPEGSEVNLLWRNIGLFDGEVRPKPAWKEWKAFSSSGAPTGDDISALPVPKPPSGAIPPTSVAPKGVQIGFREARDLFTCAPGDKVSLVAIGPKAGVSSMLWDFHYKGDWHFCLKEHLVGRVTGAKTVRLWIRSDRDGPVFVRVDEAGGESFYRIVSIGQEWQLVSLELANLSVDTSTKQDGQLDPSQIAAVMIADAAALDGATGRRKIWISEWVF